MTIRNAIASLAVRDLRTALQWYERLLGRAPDTRPMPGLAEWSFPGGGWLQVYELPERAGRGSCTLAVEDIEEQARGLQQQRIEGYERTNTEQAKTIMLTDADGNHIAFAQAMEPGFAR